MWQTSLLIKMTKKISELHKWWHKKVTYKSLCRTARTSVSIVNLITLK